MGGEEAGGGGPWGARPRLLPASSRAAAESQADPGCARGPGPPAPSPAPYQLAPCLCSPRRVCEKKEDVPVVCGVSAGGVHLHPDRRPRCHHQDGERDHGRLLPWDHCECRGPWGLPVGGPGGHGDTDVCVLQTRSTPVPRGGGLGQLSCMLRWPRGAQGPERWGRGRGGVGGKRYDRPWPRVSPECPGRTSPVTPGL